MKIRIKDQTIRFRLTQTEVAQLHQAKFVEAKLQFSPGQVLAYGLYVKPHDDFDIQFTDQHVQCHLPEHIVHTWALSDQVAIHKELDIAHQITLKLMVEKDFKCLTVRPEENEDDMFPNPNQSH